MTEEIHARNCFPGGLPPAMIFEQSVAEVDRLVEEIVDVEFDGSVLLNPRVEIALIGLVAYFEAFCRGQFASIINICPLLLKAFGRKRGPVSIPPDDLFQATDHPQPHIGFLLAEQYDFGGSRAINGLFRDLLEITPFSSDDASRYEALLHDRHLLVHHGGTYTLQYAKQRLPEDQVKQLAFHDSILIKKQDYLEASKFISSIVEKMARATYHKLDGMFRGRETDLPMEQFAAIGYLKHWD